MTKGLVASTQMTSESLHNQQTAASARHEVTHKQSKPFIPIVEEHYTFFQEVERRLNKPITKGGILDNKKCLEAVREFLELKLHWPFRPDTFTGLGNYFFGDQLYSKPPIDYEALGETTSACDIILQELVSDFGSVNELREAENILYGLIDKVVSASFTTSQK